MARFGLLRKTQNTFHLTKQKLQKHDQKMQTATKNRIISPAKKIAMHVITGGLLVYAFQLIGSQQHHFQVMTSNEHVHFGCRMLLKQTRIHC